MRRAGAKGGAGAAATTAAATATPSHQPSSPFSSPPNELPSQQEDDDNMMNNLGIYNLGVDGTEARRAHEKRLRKGLCPYCGIKCFKITGNLLGKRKQIPLTIAGHVKDGVCLTCNVIAYGTDATDHAAVVASDEINVPQFITDDNETVISGITLDHHLWMFPGEEQDNQRQLPTAESRWGNNGLSSHVPVDMHRASAPSKRPEPSASKLGETDDRPQMPRRRPSDSPNVPAMTVMMMMQSSSNNPHHGTTAPQQLFHTLTHPSSKESSRELKMALVEDDEDDEEDETIDENERKQQQKERLAYYPPTFPEEIEESEHDDNEIFFDLSKSPVLEKAIVEGRDSAFSHEPNTPTLSVAQSRASPSNSQRDISVDPRTLPLESLALVPDLYPITATTRSPPISSVATVATSRGNDSRKSSPQKGSQAPRLPVRHLTLSDPEVLEDEQNNDYSAADPSPILPTHLELRQHSVGTDRVAMPSRYNSNKDQGNKTQTRKQSIGTDTPRMPIRKGSNHTTADNTTAIRSTRGSYLKSVGGDVSDVPILLQILQNSPDSTSRVASLEELGGCLFDKELKRMFCTSGGVIAVTYTMWIDIADVQVQAACVEVLLALVAKYSPDEPDFLIGDDGQSAIDALLIVMQRLLDEADIQERGCRVLGCLARASSVNDQVSDGSTTGAVLTILNAMDAHRDSKRIMEWGIRALYEFCTFSRHSRANKHDMWAQALRSGEAGWTLLIDALDFIPEDAVTLLWVLSSSDDGLQNLVPAEGIVLQLFRLIQKHQKDRLASLLIEAALGCIANLASIETNLRQVDPTDVCLLAMGLIPVHMRTATSLCSEACAVVQRLASYANKQIIVDQGGIEDLALSMTDHHNDEALHEDAIKTMLTLMKESPPVKEAVTVAATFAILMKLFRTYESSGKWQTIACQFFASVFAMNGVLPADLERDSLNAVCFAMTLHAHVEQVQEAACVALGNLSGRQDSNDLLSESEALELILLAMEKFPSNRAIQVMGCTILWNLEYKLLEEDDVGEVDVVKIIVTAIKNHLESDKLLEVACGALLNFIYGSDSQKRRVAHFGGVEAITWALVMHFQTTSVLEKVCEVLASLSACPDLADAIIASQCIGNMVEALRSNASIGVFRSAALFLKNVVVAEPRSCEDAANAITTIVKAMQTHKNDSDLQREACNYLWSVAALSQDGKSKILALDGVSVLMETLEVYHDSADVQEAALGAFHEIALSPVH